MKIVQLIDSLRPGGSERMSVNLANLFSAKGMPNLLMVSREKGSLADQLDHKENLRSFKKQSAFDLITLWKMGLEVRQFRPDVIHAHSTSIFWAILLKWTAGRPLLIWHDHFGLDPYVRKRKYMKWLKPFINGVVVVKPELETWCRNFLGMQKVSYLYNFPVLQTMDIPRQSGKILCLANFRKQKDHLTLLRAIDLIRNEFPLLELHVVGQVIEPDYYQVLHAFVREHHLEKQVYFHTDGTYTEMHLCSSEIGVLSSESEGLPLSLLEYGLAGLAVIATAVGSCEEVIGDKENGIIIPPKSPEKLASAFNEVLADQQSANKMGMNFKKRVEHEFSGEKFFKGYVELIRECR